MWVLTLADLRLRARQFAIAAVGGTLVFAMALVMSGLSGGFRAEAQRTVDAVGADGFVVPTGAGGPFTSQATLPARTVHEVAARPGVTAAAPLAVLQHVLHSSHGESDVHVVGFVNGRLGQPPLPSGLAHLRPGQAIVDNLTKVSTGESFVVGGVHLRAVGTLHGYSYFAGVPSIYITLHDAQKIGFDGRNFITAVAVRGTPHSLPQGLASVTNAAATADVLRRLNNGLSTIDICKWFLWLMAAVIIGAVIYLSALERIRDFAVLKAIGATTGTLYLGLAIQGTIIAVFAALLAMGVEAVFSNFVPMELVVPSSAFLLLPLVGVVVGLLASLSGLRQAIRVDPAAAFGGP